MANTAQKKVVLAYSGGLDTSIIIPWLKERGWEVHCYAGDVGQGADELVGLEEKAAATGAASCKVGDLQAEFVTDTIWPALRALASDVEMVLAKSDLAIAARYAPLAGDVGARLFPVIEDEHARTTAAILEALEQDELLASEPTLQRAIRLRNPYVDPMSFLQADALGRWREGGREDEALERLLVQTVRGIARGLRNTG